MQFAGRDTGRVPEHWQTFGRRASLVTGASHKATKPANAIHNYPSAIAEAEARVAALAVGGEPGIGIMHANQRSRGPLACDSMKAVRPLVDAWVLGLLGDRTFRRSGLLRDDPREGQAPAQDRAGPELRAQGA